MRNLKGLSVIVTGAGKGIGKAIALAFAGEGARVVLAARSAGDLNKLAGDIQKKGGSALTVPTDIRNEEEVKSLIERACKAYRAVDILVNNAGLGIHNPVVEFPVEDWDVTMDTNLKGMFLCSREALKVMLPVKSGQIINIGSMAGRNGIAGLAAYCASKWGVIGFTESLAQEVRNHNIRVSVVMPGSVATDFGRGDSPSYALKPEEVAEVVLNVARQDGQTWTSEVALRPLVTKKEG
jgi:3-oxoacyl-[acyl-carrier protein] reductase